MNCNCIEEYEKEYSEAATKQLGVEAKAEIQGVVFPIVDWNIERALSVPILITAETKGYRRGKEQKLIATYCPFCGVKAFEPKEADKDE